MIIQSKFRSQIFFSVCILTFTNMAANYSSPEDSDLTDAGSEDFYKVFYDNAN